MASYTHAAFANSLVGSWSNAMGTSWYWNTSTGNTSAPSGTVEFRETVVNTASAPIWAHMHMLADDSVASVAVNGTTVCTNCANYNTVTDTSSFFLQPGTNVVAIRVTNGSGGAGFVAQVIDYAGVVRGASNTWKY